MLFISSWHSRYLLHNRIVQGCPYLIVIKSVCLVRCQWHQLRSSRKNWELKIMKNKLEGIFEATRGSSRKGLTCCKTSTNGTKTGKSCKFYFPGKVIKDLKTSITLCSSFSLVEFSPPLIFHPTFSSVKPNIPQYFNAEKRKN